MTNESGLEPVGCAVLVQTYEPERKKSLIAIPDEVKSRMDMVEQRAIVVALGPEAWKSESAPRANPGDKVLVSKYAGYIAKGTADGKPYRLVNDRDIFCKIVSEKEDV